MTPVLIGSPADLALSPGAAVAEYRATTAEQLRRRGALSPSVYDEALHTLSRLTVQGLFEVADPHGVRAFLAAHAVPADFLLAGRAALLERLPGAAFALEVDADPETGERKLVAYAEVDAAPEAAVEALLGFYRDWLAAQPVAASRAVAFDLRLA